MSETSSQFRFCPDEPLAYFLTWTTYGTWLPGDERGWHRKDDPDIQRPDPSLTETARSQMKESAFRLSTDHRRLVEETIRKHCEIREWVLHAVNARTNHVHVVVTAAGYQPETVSEQLKAWCARRLREAGASRKTFWTEGGNRRWINREDDLEAAVVYVREAQDRKEKDSL
jgi:REP element-mobilizing transposase RayT